MPRPKENPADVPYDRPQVRILNDAQWLFIRRYFRISPRELEVAKFICCGFNNDEIAAKLKIRSATVKTHLRNVYRRIHVQRKLDMLLRFLDHCTRFYDSSSKAALPRLYIKQRSSYGSQHGIAGEERPAGD